MTDSKHDQLQRLINTKPNTYLPQRGLYKAIVRKIPTFLSKDEFWLGLNCTFPVANWYFCPRGSQPPSLVALLCFESSIARPQQFSQAALALHHSCTEFSVAYFGFDDQATMHQFIERYQGFQISDGQRNYALEVSTAIHLSMPVPQEDEPEEFEDIE
jgi:hypothetical protein